MIAGAGEIGDRVQFCEYIQRNSVLYALREDIILTPSAFAHYARFAASVLSVLSYFPSVCFFFLCSCLSVSSELCCAFCSSTLATALRRNPFQVNLLIGGFDPTVTTESKEGAPALYYMDYLASLLPCNKAAHGYASHFVFRSSISFSFDRLFPITSSSSSFSLSVFFLCLSLFVCFGGISSFSASWIATGSLT